MVLVRYCGLEIRDDSSTHKLRIRGEDFGLGIRKLDFRFGFREKGELACCWRVAAARAVPTGSSIAAAKTTAAESFRAQRRCACTRRVAYACMHACDRPLRLHHEGAGRGRTAARAADCCCARRRRARAHTC
eukprot:3316305-Pleurochrysis_carterae.AAC.4